ncbi:UPF0182 family protein [Imhoffiella purpurea]|uniref:UPF0182 protein D779_0452 n=1 Tax=Imhoffiella purpurea TaxID=1249627 RepID=W9W164_9GAMM|nr:UPF0182 family protein [Imhoffiella purpurea]EXJ16310.1 UPF0182 protein [Imhoffiella purpurea]
MRKPAKAILILLSALLATALIGLALGYFFNRFIVDLWWFKSLGYEPYFWSRLIYRYLVFGLAAALFFAIFFLNFWIGAKYLGARHPLLKEEGPKRRAYRRIYDKFQQRSLLFYLPLTLGLAILLSLPLYAHWESALLYLTAPSAGISDPVYGKDVSYYLFSLPIYLLLFRELLLSFGIVLLGLLALYWLEMRALPKPTHRWRRGARIHLGLIVFLTFLTGAWYFALQADLLLYTDKHLPVFFGPGYLEMTVTLPLIVASMAMLLIVGVVFIYFVNTGKGAKTLLVSILALFAIIGIRHLPATTDLMQEFVVTPNEIAVQKPYIAHNIEATLDAYGLQDVERREYPIREGSWDLTTPEVQIGLRNAPIWDEKTLLKVYRELQEIRTYYRFDSVDVDRYSLRDDYMQVFLTPREIDLDRLPSSAQTWVNRWLKYTHGFGIAMTPAAQERSGPMTWIVKDIPPTSDYGLQTSQPAIYYGMRQNTPVIAPNDSREIDYATGNDVKLSDYQGSGGVPVDTLFRKMMFALYFQEKNILYTTQTNADSRLLFRRNVVERISHLTPFLMLDPDPYAVITPSGIYWIQDAYTYSSRYPYAAPHEVQLEHSSRRVNYIRNSVKIVVDAYNGSVDYYVTDRDDPIVSAYARIYPGLFEPFDAMPNALKRHVRYPKTLFDVQADVYATYHQTDPGTFYKQEDLWVLPQVHWRNRVETIDSYYLTLNLIDPERFEYNLFVPMNPKDKRNLRALMVAGCDGDNYGRIVTYDFPKGKLVYGPAQFDAVVKQDPDITQQFTLWNQEGSRAIRGRIIIVPVNGVISYIQGVFLEATTTASIPELARFIVSQGELAVMKDSLPESLNGLNERIEQVTNRPEPTQKLAPPTSSPRVTPPERLPQPTGDG